MPEHPPPLSAGTIALQMALVFALVLANGLFVAAEFSLVSVRRTRIDQLAAEGNGAAAVVQRIVRDLDRYIAATQVGITVASLLLGSIGEKTLEPLLAPLYAWMPDRWMGLTHTAVATGFAYFIMTAMHVIIGELMPKSLALQKSETTALWLARPMAFFAKLFTPLIWILNGTGNFLLARLGLQAPEGHGQVHSPEELDILFTQSHEGGEINATEREILHRVVKFSDLTAREVTVPRVEIQGIPLEMSRRELTELVHHQPHTRMPVYVGSLDEVVGIIHLKDLVRFESELEEAEKYTKTSPDSDTRQNVAANQGQETENKVEMVNLMPLVREAARVPETITIDRMLVEFKRRRQQMAIVIDEYGGTSGLITMGDLLDQVFGDVPDEFDEPEAEIQVRDDGRVQLPGRTLIDEVNELYSTGFRTDEVDTMAGLVLSALGRPAEVGEEVEINNVHIRVEAVDRLRITTLSLQLPTNENTPEGDGVAATTPPTAASVQSSTDGNPAGANSSNALSGNRNSAEAEAQTPSTSRRS